LEAIYQKPNTSQRHPDHKVYPYLLRGLSIDRPNQVWCADITYIPMARGFVYLVARGLAFRINLTVDFSLAGLRFARLQAVACDTRPGRMRWKNLVRAGKVLRIRELAMPRCMRSMTC